MRIIELANVNAPCNEMDLKSLDPCGGNKIRKEMRKLETKL
jgi:hypothetical protein